jgi:signal transduction histidine kinase
LITQIPPLPEDVHIGFYRIAQEGLNNVMKHARASSVEIRLGAIAPQTTSANPAECQISLVIADDGVGFAMEDPYSEHMGLGIMRERAVAVGAALSIESQLTQGTTITLVWPASPGSYHE